MIFESEHPDIQTHFENVNLEFSNWVQEVQSWIAEYGEDREQVLRPAISRRHNIAMEVIGLLDDPGDERNWEPVDIPDGMILYRPNGKTRVSKAIARELEQLTWHIPELPGMPRTWVKTDWRTGNKEQHRYGTEFYGDTAFVTWGCDGVDYDADLWKVSTQERLDEARRLAALEQKNG